MPPVMVSIDRLAFLGVQLVLCRDSMEEEFESEYHE